ncbi:MAG TPA: formylglycine-generating enzyme family protein [Steroidobacteraceae bacterium]|nr:formylglycine-generating enzyme family protein [Steroidobacteraceae bacterium]
MRALTLTLALLAVAVALAQPPPAPKPGAPPPAAAKAAAPPAGPAGTGVPAAVGAIRDCPACPDMVMIPAGTFVLGTSADAGERDPDRGESPPLPVTISRAFAIGRFEVTVGEFRVFVAATQYAPAGDCRVASGGAWVRLPDRGWQEPGFPAPQADGEPVVCVSWDDAKAYTDWLTRLTGKLYRLPSETEWEYAARGGTATPRFFGDQDSDEDTVLSVACDYANVYDASAVAELRFPYPSARCNDGRAYTAPVGSYRPNAFDLYDMIGNVREWLHDCYTASYLGRPPDGRAWEWAGGCELRGVRGGSWATRPAESRAAARGAEMQGLRQSDLGFRVVREL